jgi:hypothetical protein
LEDVAGHALRVAAPTLVRLTSSRSGSPEGEPLALAAQVRSVDPCAPIPTGTVAFRNGRALLGTATLDAAGQAVLDGVRLAPGVHAITASYSGDHLHAAASSTALPQAVTASAAPVVVLVAPPHRVPDAVHLEAEVVDPGSGRLAEDACGTVVFTVGSATVARAELVGGHARAVVPALPRGRLRAAYGGDAEHAACSGAQSETAARA